MQLNASYRSLNGMVTLFRPSANIEKIEKNCNTAFNISNVQSYLYRIAGTQYPQDSIDINSVETKTAGLNISRAYMEASKTMAPHGHTHAKTTAVSQARFCAADAAGANVGAGSLCISLTRFSDQRLINLGLNTSGNSAPSILEVDFTAAPQPQDCTTFTLYDCIFVLNQQGGVDRVF